MSVGVEAAAVRHLRAGRPIVHATEGVFGLAACAADAAACREIAWLKSRGPRKPFIVVAADFAQISRLIRVARQDLPALTAVWPGPETWIVPASLAAPHWLVGHDGGIAVRVTAHQQFARLCRAVGPVISTSANPAGRPPALDLGAARRYFRSRVACYLPGALTEPGRPSRIRDARSGVLVRARPC